MDWTNLEGVENKIVKGLKGLEFPARGWACGVGGTLPTDRRIQYSPNLLPAPPAPPVFVELWPGSGHAGPPGTHEKVFC